jgi:hypothetical protein
LPKHLRRTTSGTAREVAMSGQPLSVDAGEQPEAPREDIEIVQMPPGRWRT